MNFTYFFANGVQFDLTTTYPFKLLMIGFAIMILILYSAYVAKLAATLTIAGVELNLETMEGVIAKGKNVCAPATLKSEIQATWPGISCVYNYEESDNAKEGFGVLRQV